MGHGHVVPNANGSKARCGGPSICPECAAELTSIKNSDTAFLQKIADKFSGVEVKSPYQRIAEAHSDQQGLEELFHSIEPQHLRVLTPASEGRGVVAYCKPIPGTKFNIFLDDFDGSFRIRTEEFVKMLEQQGFKIE